MKSDKKLWISKSNFSNVFKKNLIGKAFKDFLTFNALCNLHYQKKKAFEKSFKKSKGESV